jgi:hypothetical protein
VTNDEVLAVQVLKDAAYYLISLKRETELHDRRTYEGEMQCRADWSAYRLLSSFAECIQEIGRTQDRITQNEWKQRFTHERKRCGRDAVMSGGAA